MNEYTLAQIQESCYAVSRGKPASVLAIKTKDIDVALAQIENSELKYMVKKLVGKIWKELWIYKRDEMKMIIDRLPDNPQTVLDHFLLGCIFGYSIDSILDFISKNNPEIGLVDGKYIAMKRKNEKDLQIPGVPNSDLATIP